MKASFLILAVAAASVASAGTINTGISNAPTATPLPTNTTDSHFSVTGPAGSGTTSVLTVPFLYSGQYYNTAGNPFGIGTANADWVTTNLGTNAPAGIYTFTETLNGFTTVSGLWATDNCGTLSVTGGGTVAVAGSTIGAGQTVATCDGANTANFHTPTAFTITGLVSGSVLTATLVNTNGPVALFIDTGAANGAPEPSSILSVLSGLGVVGFAIRRRRQAAK